jgi:O-antigen ligase
VWLSLLAFGLVVVMSRSRRALRLLKATNPFFLAFVSLCLVSVFWSIEPGVTLRRCLRLVTVTADATAFVLLARSVTNFQSVIRPILTTFLIGSVIFVIAAPKLGIEQLNQAELIGAWRGLASQKNVLGAVAAVAVLLWLHAALSKESALWKSLPGLAISALCLIKSRSSTSLMATVFASGLMLMLIRSPSSLRRYVPYITTAYACLLLLYSLAVLDLIPGSGTLLAPITTLVGKDLTFSGRTAIWDVIRENIALHPFLGGGYGAYWTGLPNSPSMEMLRRLYFYPTESHNGYIDVYNDLGLVGEICLVGFVITYVRQGITIYKTSRSQGALYLSLLFQQMIGNLSEARWFNALNGDLIIVTIATMALARSLCDQTVPTAKRQTSRPTPSARPGDEVAIKRRPAFHLRNRRTGPIAK